MIFNVSEGIHMETSKYFRDGSLRSGKSISLFRIIIFLISLLVSLPVLSQSIKNVRINEIQVYNVNGFRDEYGRANAWIELYNKGYGKVNIAGCSLKVNEKIYHIPQGDPSTVIATQGYVVFFAGGIPDKGTFHTNLTLEDAGWIEFADVDGKCIHRLEFNPAEMVDGVSYGYIEDSDGMEKWMQLPATTPGSSNNTEDLVARAELFRKADPAGIVLTILSIAIVAITLTLLFFIFKYMGNFHIRIAVKKAERTSRLSFRGFKIAGGRKKRIITNDELAAIAIALYKYSGKMHDKENTVLTINEASKVYSPWSSKIYSLRQYPRK